MVARWRPCLQRPSSGRGDEQQLSGGRGRFLKNDIVFCGHSRPCRPSNIRRQRCLPRTVEQQRPCLQRPSSGRGDEKQFLGGGERFLKENISSSAAMINIRRQKARVGSSGGVVFPVSWGPVLGCPPWPWQKKAAALGGVPAAAQANGRLVALGRGGPWEQDFCVH